MIGIAPPYGRKESMDKVLALLSGRKEMVFVEIGSTRTRGQWEGDGYSTPFFSWVAENSNSSFYTVDIHPTVTQTSKDICAEYGLGVSENSKIHFITEDGILFAKNWEKLGVSIDLLYLDAWDWEVESAKNSEEKHLEAATLFLPHLSPNTIVMIDDTLNFLNWEGKGRLAIPFLLENKFKIIHPGRQTVLVRNGLSIGEI